MLDSWRHFPHCNVSIVNTRISEIVNRVRGPRVLEVGCGSGFLSKAVNETHGFKVVSTDNSPAAIESAKQSFGIDVLRMDANMLDFPSGYFDTVLGCEVLEHVDNPGIALAEMFRVSKGHVIITLPLGEYWLGKLTHLWQINGCMIDHGEPAKAFNAEKHCIVIQFDRKR